MKRVLLLSLGCISLAVGIIGIFLPLIPTTGPLLLAALCFDRSSPRFHAWLLNNRYLGGYVRNYREGRGLPLMQKICTIGLLWTSITLSIVFAVDAWWGRALLAAVAIGVTLHVATLPTYRPETEYAFRIPLAGGHMKKPLLWSLLVAAAIVPAAAQIAPGQGVAGMNVDKVVEMDQLTQTELADKIKNGWTSAFLVAGGTEIRGPHAVIGVHNVLATHRAVEAARRLGKTIVAPTIPFAVAATGGYNANSWKAYEDTGSTAPNPGAIQVDAATFKGIVQGGVESLMFIGFKDIFLMGDHGGGQNEMKQVSEEMSAKYQAKGIRVHYVGDFYQKTHDDIDMYMYEHKLPIAGHGGMMETAEMMYWEPTQYAFIRPIYKTVPFDGTRFEGESLEADLKAWKDRKDGAAAGGQRAGGGGQRAAGAGGGQRGAGTGQPRANNGLSGNPHFATKEIGKDLAEIGISNTVNQVRALLAQRVQ